MGSLFSEEMVYGKLTLPSSIELQRQGGQLRARLAVEEREAHVSYLTW